MQCMADYLNSTFGSFCILLLILHINLQIIKAACEFKIYDYSDSDNYAANNGWTRLSYDDLQNAGEYKTKLINFLNTKGQTIQALSTWSNSNCCMAYAESQFITFNSNQYLKVATSCSDCYTNFIISNWYSMCDFDTKISSMAYTDAFNLKTTCSNEKNAAFYRKCPTISPTPAPTIYPTPSPTYNPTLLPTPAPTTNPTKNPTQNPSVSPIKQPTSNPTLIPTISPTLNPTLIPTISPTLATYSPTQIPTLNPTYNPSISPTKLPTPSPTFPEGAVGDDEIDNTSAHNTDGDDELQSGNTSGGIFNDLVLYIIIAGAVGLFVICCIFVIYFYKKRRKAKLKHKSINGTGIIHMGATTTNSMKTHIELGSVSPRSMNSAMTNPMSFETAGAIEMDTNYDNGEEQEDDNDNELFGITGHDVTVGENIDIDNNNNDIQLPELPDQNNEVSDEESEVSDNQIYMKQITTQGGSDLELYANTNVNPSINIPKKICKLCDECGKSVNANDGGKLDENDGNWYCIGCWNSFYE